MLRLGASLRIKPRLADKLLPDDLGNIVDQPQEAKTRQQLGVTRCRHAVNQVNWRDAGLVQVKFNMGAVLTDARTDQGTAMDHCAGGDR